MAGAQVFFARPASSALAAANPGIDRNALANYRSVGRLSRAFDYTGDLMPKRERQRTILCDVEAFVGAEREIAILQMQIGVTHAATFDAHQHLAAARRRTIHDGFAKRLAVGDQRLAVEFRHRAFILQAVYATRSCSVIAEFGKSVRQCDKSFNGNVFGARSRVKTGGGKQCRHFDTQ